uniref:Uncharacterized protein n=1 Tax=Chromera velia CCMP2878 TaxID=1169474 RepID=A0A0G4HR03_9ALVE|eukprot:Cvel_8063.t1-p1 / transcript=Cvel_8063.t1 / gene=Cvel_8063 / organism=Chromera_velia_CCMP2878 / gene_product=hypothetical protein / transcript_product=hypothetical protein / location=Cvel_scaffold436:79571-86317(-) / protein_length=499 / sequence_SO=supercontig / SO=protein_coding / is_pseudo=false
MEWVTDACQELDTGEWTPRAALHRPETFLFHGHSRDIWRRHFPHSLEARASDVLAAVEMEGGGFQDEERNAVAAFLMHLAKENGGGEKGKAPTSLDNALVSVVDIARSCGIFGIGITAVLLSNWPELHPQRLADILRCEQGDALTGTIGTAATLVQNAKGKRRTIFHLDCPLTAAACLSSASPLATHLSTFKATTAPFGLSEAVKKKAAAMYSQMAVKDRHKLLQMIYGRRLVATAAVLSHSRSLHLRAQEIAMTRSAECHEDVHSDAWAPLQRRIAEHAQKESVLRSRKAALLRAETECKAGERTEILSGRVSHLRSLLHELAGAEAEATEAKMELKNLAAVNDAIEANFQKEKAKKDLAYLQLSFSLRFEEESCEILRSRMHSDLVALETLVLNIEDDFVRASGELAAQDMKLTSQIAEKEALLVHLSQGLASAKEASRAALSLQQEKQRQLAQITAVLDLTAARQALETQIASLEEKLKHAQVASKKKARAAGGRR